MRFLSLFSLRVLLLASLVAISLACSQRCRLRFCGPTNDALVGAHHLPATPAICRISSNQVTDSIGELLQVGPTSILRQNSSRYTRSVFFGLPNQLFRLTPAYGPYKTNSALLFAASTEQRKKAIAKGLEGACVRVPITRWRQKSTIRNGIECIAFRLRFPAIRIDLSWDSKDDFDLFVTQPDQKQVFFTPTSDRGRLLVDEHRSPCEITSDSAVETIVYDRRPYLKGSYTAFAEHCRTCRIKSTRWNMTVALNGRLVALRRGVANTTIDEGFVRGSQASFHL